MDYHKLLSEFYSFGEIANVIRVTYESIDKDMLVITCYCNTFEEFEYEIRKFIVKSITLLQSEKNIKITTCLAKFVLNFEVISDEAFTQVDFGCIVNGETVEQYIIDHIKIGILQIPNLKNKLNKIEQEQALAEFENMTMKNTDLN